MKYWIRLVRAVSLYWELALSLLLVAGTLVSAAWAIYPVFFPSHSGSTQPSTHTNGSSLQVPSYTLGHGQGDYITTGESIVTVYMLHDGCGQTEYWEYQVPSTDIKCSPSG